MTDEVVSRLGGRGLRAQTIRRDNVATEAGESLSVQHGGIRYMQANRNASDLYQRINRHLVRTAGKFDITFLEGGTRTPGARAITLEGVNNPLTIVRLDVSPFELVRRLAHRRRTIDRPDDNPLIIAGKLVGQAKGNFMARHQDYAAESIDFIPIDANRPMIEVADDVEQIALDRLQ